MSAEKIRNNGTMTEAQFLSWIRSALRSKTLQWLPRKQCLDNAKRPYKGANKLQKWEYQCALCKQWWKLKEVEADHYPKDAGSIPNIQAVGEFCNNLFVEVDGWRCLCKGCHSIHTYMQRYKVSWEEADVKLKAGAVMKSFNKAALIKALKAKGFTEAQLSNEDKRKAVVEQLIREGEAVD
jgi:uncharacterized Zn ribbon protein